MLQNSSLKQTITRSISHQLLDYLVATSLILIASYVRIYTPLSSIPFTLQTFAVLFAAYRYKNIGVMATVTTMLVLSSPLTVGYRIGMLVMSYLMSKTRHFIRTAIISHLITYTVGVLYICLFVSGSKLAWPLTYKEVMSPLSIYIFPFILTDSAKMYIAYLFCRVK
jgi:biotin transporter BioY